jgi:AcrR family transcriptional regulator
MAAPPKPRRRTKERVLESALAMYNRFGEPNVSINAVAGDMGISPGNLYYHYPSKDSVTQALVEHHARALHGLLGAAGDVADVESAWFFLHTLFEHIWDTRFVYRDQNDLLTKSLPLEALVRELLEAKVTALSAMLGALQKHGWIAPESTLLPALAQNMALLINYWLSFAYVRNPRQALEPASQQNAVLTGALHTLGLLLPYLTPPAQAHLQVLMRHYQPQGL